MESMNKNTEIRPPKVVGYIIVMMKIVVYIFVMLGITAFLAQLIHIIQLIFPDALEINGIMKDMVFQTCFLAGAFLSAIILLRSWNHLPFADLGLSLKGRAKDFLWGTLVALIIYAVGFGILYGLEEIEVVSVHFSLYDLAMTWILMLLVAVTEEVAFRGFVLGRMLNAGINRFVALFLSSAIFSMMHISNPNFSSMSFLNIMLAGVLMGSTYLYTRNLWFPIALHLFWNWFQGPVLGFGVSGAQYGNSLLTLNFPEDNIINGGAFGFESSVLCTALTIIAIMITLKSASKQFACDPCPHSAPAPARADE